MLPSPLEGWDAGMLEPAPIRPFNNDTNSAISNSGKRAKTC